MILYMLQLHQPITHADETTSVHRKYYNPLVIIKQHLLQEKQEDEKCCDPSRGLNWTRLYLYLGRLDLYLGRSQLALSLLQFSYKC